MAGAGFPTSFKTITVGTLTVTTVAMRVPDGTVDVPSIAFSSETGLGFYRMASGKVALAAGGANVVVFDSGSGNYDFNGSIRPATDNARTLGTSSLQFTEAYVSTAYYVAANKVLGARGAAVADASGGATVDTQARAAINALLARCRVTGGHGLIAD